MQDIAISRSRATTGTASYTAPVLGVLIAIGAYLRLADLGTLGFRWDEDLSSLAVQAILQNGIPELPSGMVYLRGGSFLYLMAASAELLGFSEASLRLPAALFGIGLIPLGYVFARSLFDARTGLVVAGLLAVSQWDVEFSRYARMYAPFIFFYLLTLYCLWKYRVQSVSAGGGALCVALAMCAVSLHQLGYTLVLAFFYPLILRGPAEWLRPRNWVYPMLSGGIVAAFFFLWSGVVDFYMRAPIRMEGQSEPVPPAAAQTHGGILRDELPLLGAMLEAAPVVMLALAAVLLLAAAAFLGRRSTWPVPDRLLLLLVAVCCALQLFNLALLALLGLAFVKRAGLAAVRRPDVIFAAGFIAVSFAVWVALATGLGLATAEGGQAAGLKDTIRSLLDYPHFFVFWGYPREWPMLSVVALIGGLYAFDRASRPAKAGGRAEGSEASAFLLLALGTPLIVNGLFDTSFELFRYNVPFNTLYFTLVALALVHWRNVVAAAMPPGRRFAPPARAAAAGTAALALLMLAFDLNPLRAWLVTRQDYRNDGALYRAFDLERRPDFKTPAAYLASHAEAADLVIVLDSREYYNYLGELDYWVRTDIYESQTYSRDGRLHDRYIDTPLIMSLDELKSVLQLPNRRKWLMASDAMLATTQAVSDDIKSFIREQDGHVVYVGRDGESKVYRFE